MHFKCYVKLCVLIYHVIDQGKEIETETLLIFIMHLFVQFQNQEHNMVMATYFLSTSPFRSKEYFIYLIGSHKVMTILPRHFYSNVYCSLFPSLFLKIILHSNSSSPSLPSSNPRAPPITPLIHFSEEVRPPFVSQQSLIYQVEAGPRPLPTPSRLSKVSLYREWVHKTSS